MEKVQTTFEELVRAIVRWAEDELGLHLYHFAPGPESTVMTDQNGRDLSIEVNEQGEPVLDGAIAGEIDVAAALAAHRAEEARKKRMEFAARRQDRRRARAVTATEKPKQEGK